MIKHTYICDCCNSEVDEEDLFKLKLNIIYPKPKPGWKRALTIPEREFDVCDMCLNVKNIVEGLNLNKI